MNIELNESSRIAMLGSCSGELRDSQGTTSYIIDDTVAIDVGTGLLSLSTEQTSRIEHIILSHQHFDHICSLPLLINTHFLRYLKKPLQVWTHPKTIEAIKTHIFNDQIWPDFAAIPNQIDGVLQFNPVEHYQPTRVGGLELTLIPVVHTVLSSAVAVRSKKGGIIYSSDTTVNDALWQFINDNESFHTLFVECTFTNSEHEMAVSTTHYCPDLLHADLKKLKRSLNVFLSHSPNQIKQTIIDELNDIITKEPFGAWKIAPEHPVVGHYYTI
ncbi:MAG: 3',5'-cyclic-nucleotide phosphodiesterase [Gammaproteobacteria bacterium]|nr:3',5'-cyclic-nucleotide phosphodiesterase [Pseudomonadota bacterium]MCH9663195.1 3',5'-cyclic-nucleotide phosphodiesterase [Gammaproteobacteria bacterium]